MEKNKRGRYNNNGKMEKIKYDNRLMVTLIKNKQRDIYCYARHTHPHPHSLTHTHT